MIETDCPFCDINSNNKGYQYVKTHFERVDKSKYDENKLVKTRNEPCTVVQVVEVLSALHQISEQELCQIVWENTLKMFGIE